MGAEAITVKLRELLLDVATSRRELEDDPQQFLEILVGAAALYPVFDGWPSPVYVGMISFLHGQSEDCAESVIAARIGAPAASCKAFQRPPPQKEKPAETLVL